MALNVETKDEILRKFSKVNGILNENTLINAGYEGVKTPDGMGSKTFINAMLWCNNNLQGEYEYMGGKFWFTDSRDALSFKLVWL
jgi:hypothetical protein